MSRSSFSSIWKKEVIAFATQLGFKLQPRVSVQQLKAIEINPYAFELAQVSVCR